MIISIYNKKGGVGKTSLSFNIAKDLDFFILSNDDSVLEKIYPKKAKIIKKLKIFNKDYDFIYDLGGFLDDNLIDIFKNSDLIIVPSTLDANSIKRTINTVLEINHYCKKIIIIINRVKKNTKHKYLQSIKALEGLDKPIFEMRESEAIPNSIYLAKTIFELELDSPLSKSIYKNIVYDYTAILEEIQRIKNEKK